MPYIPPNAKWYLADMVEEITIEDEPNNMVHINLVLVRADFPEEAYEKALELGKESEISYLNTDGKWVRIIFRGLRGLNVIHDELEHGAELLYEEKIGLSDLDVRNLIRPKEALNVFAPRETDE